MKTIGRLLIAAVAMLAGGIWTLVNYCNGATSFNFGWPMDGSKLSVNLTTIGPAVWAGLPSQLASRDRERGGKSHRRTFDPPSPHHLKS